MPTVKEAPAAQYSSKQKKSQPVQTREIGIVIRRFESPYYSSLIDTTVKQLNFLGLDATVRSSQGTAAGEIGAFNALIHSGCKGVLFHSEMLKDKALCELSDEHPNSLFLGRYVPALKQRCIYSDNNHGGKEAAQYLLNKGHRKFAMVKGPDDRFVTQQRTQGFLEELRRHGIYIPNQLILTSNFHETGGAAAMTKLLPLAAEFTAVFFQSDTMAIGALSVCAEHGVSVPNDISIVGYDDITVSRYCVPSLTSVHTPLAQWGWDAASLMDELTRNNLDNLIGDSRTHQHSPYIVDRDSVSDIRNPSTTSDKQGSSLTKRERDCLQWTARGKTSWEISIILGVTESTVVFHLRNSITKMEATNRTQAVAIALSQSLITL